MDKHCSHCRGFLLVGSTLAGCKGAMAKGVSNFLIAKILLEPLNSD